MRDPIRELTEAIRNLDRRLRKLENAEPSLFGGEVPALQGSWVNTGAPYPNAAYWRDASNQVWLRGRVQGGAVPSTLFTLPEGYRPIGTRSFATALGDVIEVDTAGAVTVVSGASPVSLDGVTFRAYA